MKMCIGAVGTLLIAIFVLGRIPLEAGCCQHPEKYTPPAPAAILVPPLVVHQVQGRAIVDARNKVIPISEVGGACMSLFTEKTHQFVASTATDKRGRFSFPDVAPGRYRLVARSKGFCTGNTRIEVVTSTEGVGKARILVHIRVHEVDGCSFAEYDKRTDHKRR